MVNDRRVKQTINKLIDHVHNIIQRDLFNTHRIFATSYYRINTFLKDVRHTDKKIKKT